MRRSKQAPLIALGGVLLALGSSPALRPAQRALPPRPARPDVILITLDTLRADAPGFAGNRRVATPLLDRLAASGRVFPDAHAHSVATLPSHTNILTGLYPYQHGVRDNSGFRLGPSIPTLATLLGAAGYATGAFVGAFPLDSQFGLGRGFAVYDDRTSRGLEGEQVGLSERRGDEVVAAALAWWRREERGGRPRFLWVHLFDAHAPYEPPEPFATRYKDDPYLGEVAAIDSYLQPLLGPFLDRRGDRREPAPFVVLTADHGESRGEHGEKTHGLFAYEATLKVPLVLWGPGVAPGRDLRPARLVDLFPTVLQAARVPMPAPAPGRPFPGRSLLGPPVAIPEDCYFEALSANFNLRWAPLRGAIHRGRKFIDLPLPEVYDLARDPGERHNLFARERAAARAVFASLPRETAPAPTARREDVAPETAARLESLGYLVGAGSAPARYGPADDPKNLVGLDRKMHDVVELSTRGRLDQAVALARAVVKERPTMPFAQSLLALCLLESGRREEALGAMEAARRRGVVSEPLLRQLGLTLAQVGRTAEALAVLKPLAATGSPAAGNALALALSQAGRQEEAATVERQVLAVDPGNARAHERLGLIEVRRGRFREASFELEQAVAANPRLVNAWNNLGVALYGLGQPQAALTAWQRALDLEPQLWDTLWNLGTKAAEQGHMRQARAALERFAAAAPKERYGDEVSQARQLLALWAHRPAHRPTAR
jgi:arylsulfatase A-like enzyme/tetratricopeptide (TPR) repeat protein